MTLQTVTVTWDEEDVGGGALGGYVSFQLTADLQDQADGIDVRRSPAKTFFFTGPAGSSDPLTANDSPGVTPAGTAYVITVAVSGQQPVTFTSQILHANGSTQTLAFLQANAAVPAAQYAQFLPLPSGTPEAGQVPVVRENESEATAWGSLASLGGMVKQAATALSGYTLVNGTGDVISWTVPDDGQIHRAVIFAGEVVGSAMSGGQVNAEWTDPTGAPQAWGVLPATGSPGWNYSISPTPNLLVAPGTAVTVRQGTALTAGAATVWAEIWGS